MTTTLTMSPIESARASIAALDAAASWLADALNTVARLEDERALIKADAIRRLVESGVATSPSAAERVVERDDEYMAHRAKQRDAEYQKWHAVASFEACKLTALLDVRLAATLNSQGAE